MCLRENQPMLCPLAEVLERHFLLTVCMSKGMTAVRVSHLTGGL